MLLQMIVSDFDELIVPRIHNDYHEMMAEVLSQNPDLDNIPRQYMFRNVYFFLDFPPVSIMLHTFEGGGQSENTLFQIALPLTVHAI